MGTRRRLEASHDPPWRDNGRDSGARETLPHNQDFATASDRELRNQDETLDFLHGTVQNLKNMGGNISQEIDLQCRLLGEAEDQADVSTGRIRQQQAKLAYLTEQSSPNCQLWVCIF